VHCHGEINKMEEVYHAKPLSMNVLPGLSSQSPPNLRPKDKITQLDWNPHEHLPKRLVGKNSCKRVERERFPELLSLPSMKTILLLVRAAQRSALLAQSRSTGGLTEFSNG